MLITFNKICLVLTYNADSPTARRLCKGYRLWIIGYRRELFGTAVGEGSAAAPGRPNNKKDDAQVPHELSL